MENSELNNISKKIAALDCSDKSAVEKMIKLIDKTYIVLDELNHINYFNGRLSSIKSNLASVDCHVDEEKERFNNSKDQLLELIEESHSLV